MENIFSVPLLVNNIGVMKMSGGTNRTPMQAFLGGLFQQSAAPNSVAAAYALEAIAVNTKELIDEAGKKLALLIDYYREGNLFPSDFSDVKSFFEQSGMTEEDYVMAICALFPKVSEALEEFSQGKTVFDGYKRLEKLVDFRSAVEHLEMTLGDVKLNRTTLYWLECAEDLLTKRLGLNLCEGIGRCAANSVEVKDGLKKKNPDNLEAAFLEIKRESAINAEIEEIYCEATQKESLARYFNFVTKAKDYGLTANDVEEKIASYISQENEDISDAKRWDQIKEEVSERVCNTLRQEYGHFLQCLDHPSSMEWFKIADKYLEQAGYNDAYGDDRLAMGLKAMGFEGSVEEWSELRRKVESGAALTKTCDDPYFGF